MGPKKKSSKKGSKKAKGPSLAEAKAAAAYSLPAIPTVKTLNVMNAVGVGDTKMLTRMVYHYNHGTELCTKDQNHSTPLHMAAAKGDADMVERLFSFSEFPINVDALEIAKIGGFAAVHHACAGGHTRVLYLLLQHGANPNIQTNSSLGETPLHVCVKKGEIALECAKLLLKHGARANAVDKFGNNASFWAQSKGNYSMISTLGLPSAAGASADTMIQMMMARIPGYKVPSAAKKGKKGGKGKGKKK